jgi:hypothetical protein
MNRYAWQLLLLVTLLALIAAGKNLSRTGASNAAPTGPVAAAANTGALPLGAAAQSAVLVGSGQSICLTFDTGSGAYTFKGCVPGGFNLSGTGTIQTIGNVVVLTDNKSDRKVSAFFLLNTQSGHATVTDIPFPGTFNTLSIFTSFPSPPCGCP